MNAISIVGKKNSGKTTLLLGIIKELKERGYSVGIIKHIHHNLEISDFDKEEKDTFKHFKGGADIVAASSNKLFALFQNLSEEKTIEDLMSFFSDVDIVLTEGFKGEKMPKIEIARDEPICKKEDNLIAIVSNKDFRLDIPCFKPNDYPKIANFIEGFIKKRHCDETGLFIDGKKIPLNRFVQRVFKEAIFGMIRALDDIPSPFKKIKITIDNRNNGDL
ncbi:MAG: molybdopterin-guanine dinucleotide biosynthesis protein B [bacterium]